MKFWSKALLVIVFSCFCAPALCQDTMIYDSEMEGENILKYLKTGEIDNFKAVYFAGNADETEYNRDIKRCFDFADKLAALYPERKKVKVLKKIFAAIHDEFLVKYDIQAQFYDLFRTGTYNCVTSTALYSFILQRMDVVCRIKELPTHVYLTVEADGKVMDVETTMPQNLVPISYKQKEAYITELLNAKIITQAELNEKGWDQLFDEYYYKNNTISILQLSGLSYMNYAVLETQKLDLMKSLDILRISRNLYPRNATNALIAALLNQISQEPTKYGYLRVIQKQLTYSDMYDKESLRSNLMVYASSSVFQNGEIATFSRLDSFINENVIRNKEKVKILRFIYSKILGEYYFKNDQFPEAIKYHLAAYKLFKTDVDCKHNLLASVASLSKEIADSFFTKNNDTFYGVIVNVPELELNADYEELRFYMVNYILDLNYQRVFSKGYALNATQWNNFTGITDTLIAKPGLMMIEKRTALKILLAYACNSHEYKDDARANRIIALGLSKFPENKALLQAQKTRFKYAAGYYLNN